MHLSNGDNPVGKIIELKINLRNLSIQHWVNYEVFSWVWWIEIIISASMFVLWFSVVDKKHLRQIIIYGLLINISASFLDVLGSEFALWEYLVRIIPQIPLMYPVDFIILPIGNMIIYQYFVKWKKYLAVSLLSAAVLAFILEPLSSAIHQYKLISWKYIYSLPIYFVISIFAKFLTDKITSIESKASMKK